MSNNIETSFGSLTEDREEAGGTTTKRTVIQNTTRRRLSLSDSTVIYEEDEWEKKPKTDYTYSKTASYMKSSPTKGYKSPNMSRRSLRGLDSHEQSGYINETWDSVVTATTRESNLSQSVGEYSMVVHGGPSASDLESGVSGSQQQSQQVFEDRRRTIGGTSNLGVTKPQMKRHSAGVSKQHEEYQAWRAYDPSVTRSGTQYSLRQRLKMLQSGSQVVESTNNASVTRNINFSDIDELDYAQYSRETEKRLEYAGESIPYKEVQSPIPHLYGPDDESDESDVDLNTYYSSEKTSLSNTSFSTNLTTTTRNTSVTRTLIKRIARISRFVHSTTKSLLKSILLLLMYIIAFFATAVTSLATQSSHKLMEWTNKSYTAIVYVTYCVTKALVSSFSSGLHHVTSMTSSVFTTLTSPISYFFSKAKSVQRESETDNFLAKTQSGSSPSILSSPSKRSSKRKSVHKSVHFEESEQSTSQVSSSVNEENISSNAVISDNHYDAGERLKLTDSVAGYLLFIPSVIYAYVLYPLYSLLSTLVKNICYSFFWVYTLMRSAVYSVYTSVSSFWHTSYNNRTSSIHAQSSSKLSDEKASTLRKSTRIQKGKSVETQFQDKLQHETLQSSTTESHIHESERLGLVDVILFVPAKVYGYLIYPVGCSLWWILEYLYKSLYSGISKVSSLWKFSNANQIKTTSHDMRNKNIQTGRRTRQSRRVSQLIEESDTEDINDFVASSENVNETKCSDIFWAVILFVPKHVYELFCWLLNGLLHLLNGCKSLCQWFFVDKLANSLLSVWSMLTRSTSTYESSKYIVGSNTSSETASSSEAAATADTRLFSAETNVGTSSMNKTRSSRRSTKQVLVLSDNDDQGQLMSYDEVDTSVKKNQSSRGSARTAMLRSKDDEQRITKNNDAVYLATSRHNSGFSDCLCSALMFIPLLLYAFACAIGRLIKYVYDGLNSLFRCFFVDTVGYWSKSGVAAVKSKSQSLLAYVIYSDVWILSRTRKCGLCCLLPLILLLPLLLCGSYYVYDQGSDAVVGGIPFGSIIAGSTVEETAGTVTSEKGSGSWSWPWFLVVWIFGDSSKNNTKSETVYVYGGGSGSSDDGSNLTSTSLGGDNSKMAGGIYLTDADLQAKIREVFVTMYGEREAHFKAKSEQTTQQLLIQQKQIINQYKLDVEEMTKQIVKEELTTFAAGWNDQRNGDIAGHDKLAQDQLHQAVKIKGLQDQVTAILGQSEQLSAQILAAKDKMKLQDETGKSETLAMVGTLEEQLKKLQSDIAALQASQAMLASNLRECCKNDSSLAILVRAGVRDQLSNFMAGAMNKGASDSTASSDTSSESGNAFMMWLQNQFAKRNDIDDKIAALAAKLNEQIKSESESAAAAAIAASVAGAASDEGKKAAENETKAATLLTAGNITGLSEEQVKFLIREALYIFGADKTGMVDYALESAGGSVISTRCSETYHRRTAQLSLFGIPLWYNNNSPRTVIQPEVHPGQCWPFSGSHGYIVIQLAGVIRPTAFSLEHIPKSLSPTGKIDSAPKDFSVRGLEHEKDAEGYDLGRYTYDQDGEPLQYFTVNDPEGRAFGIVELMVESNWGNEEYTCLYRFRVHGHLQRWMGDA